MANQPLPNPAAIPTQIKRFRTNPVEIAIFSVITLIFFNSVYNLFYDQHGFHNAALTPMAANPVSEGRAPASVSQAFINVSVKCDANTDQDTTANKVRVTGSLCDTGPSNDPSHLIKTQVINNANKFTATVFTEVNAARFSTDYIPLNSGKNPIHLEFTYRGGKVVTHDITVVKN